jgi:hypothetical protein
MNYYKIFSYLIIIEIKLTKNICKKYVLYTYLTKYKLTISINKNILKKASKHNINIRLF